MKNAKRIERIAPETGREGLIAAHIEDILSEIGEDPSRDGLLATPLRAEKALRFLTSGYETNLEEIVNGAIFEERCDEMVLVKDIEFFSLCEHHLLPFYGKAHVAYIPNNRIIGLSKIPRIVDMFARRLQVQERLTKQVAECLQDLLDAQGVGVIMEARHFCMMMRGVEKQHSATTTSSMLGVLRTRKETRNEFLSLVRQNSLYA
ncbi:MAG TPA: GTP cyclohydrolase I FolE [Bryobacteraceae bacterium]|nr:GTP cyclohydrolase I FolE [Bryobacteraceae bacterium]HPT27937.1 GTP cyclohydrolase I FolE [Bryobacteraceae bacterium]